METLHLPVRAPQLYPDQPSNRLENELKPWRQTMWCIPKDDEDGDSRSIKTPVTRY